MMFSRADAYERFMGRWSRLLAPTLLDFVGLRDGDAVLDAGCGTGALAFAALDRTTTSRVAGLDASGEYVSQATASRTDPRIAFQVGDAQALPFADAEFDKTLSLLALNFIPDPARAVKDWMRVTKPGGVVSAAVWDYGEGMEMLRVFWDEVVAIDPALASRDEAHMPLCKRGELEALWQRVGLESIVEEPLVVTMRFGSFDDYWAPFLLGQGPAGTCVAGLAPDTKKSLESRLRQRLPGDEIRLQGRVWAARGTTP